MTEIAPDRVRDKAADGLGVPSSPVEDTSKVSPPELTIEIPKAGGAKAEVENAEKAENAAAGSAREESGDETEETKVGSESENGDTESKSDANEAETGVTGVESSGAESGEEEEAESEEDESGEEDESEEESEEESEDEESEQADGESKRTSGETNGKVKEEDAEEKIADGIAKEGPSEPTEAPPTPAKSPQKATHSRHSSTASTLPETTEISVIKLSLESIVAIKEIQKKQPDLVKAAEEALSTLKKGEMPPEAAIFEPLRMACEQKNVEAKTRALDCLGKVFTFNIFDRPVYVKYTAKTAAPRKSSSKKGASTSELEANVESVPVEGHENEIPLVEAVIGAICSCFDGEGTDPMVEIQIVRVLLAALVNESMPVHGKPLLQAVRQIYNVFLLSLSPVNQGVAQATLIEVVGRVFERCKDVEEEEEENENEPPIPETVLPPNGELPTLASMTQAAPNDLVQVSPLADEQGQSIKDAFLVARAMCNLAAKTVDSDTLDMRSHAMRSKLLSLHTVLLIFKNYWPLFAGDHWLVAGKVSLADGIRKYVCLVLSRNAAYQLGPIYEATLEIFWVVLQRLRAQFKYEIPVFFTEIYLPLSSMKTSTDHQKRYLLHVVARLCRDPKALLELYLNYDCDEALPNLTEQIANYLTKFANAHAEVTPLQAVAYRESKTRRLSTYEFSRMPELSVNRLSSRPPVPEADAKYPPAYALKMAAIDVLVDLVSSLDTYSGSSLQAATAPEEDSTIESDSADYVESPLTAGPPVPALTAASFETTKQKKRALQECVGMFNYSPKKGLAALLKNRLISDDSPESIAAFLFSTEGIDKTVLGEYLGEGKDQSIAVMHSFVDLMDFKQKSFLDSLRFFLQHFRLPGEAQKIDRFVLKFAEKYITDNPGVFTNADTIYVLSYSVVMLNTDLHSPQVKDRMTVEEFVSNNRGIDDGKDLDRSLLEEIYDSILHDEIKLKSEQQKALLAGDAIDGSVGAGLFGGRSQAREAYLKASRELTSKTEEVVQQLQSAVATRDPNSRAFYELDEEEDAYAHARSVYETLWMFFLAGFSAPFQTYDDEVTGQKLLEGVRLSIHLACVFGVDDARSSFTRALVQFTNINNPEDMKMKNVDAIFTLLQVAIDDQNTLKGAWKGVFIVASQVERLKLIVRGVDSQSVPDLLNARLANRNSLDSLRSSNSANTSAFSSFFSSKKPSIAEQTFQKHYNQKVSVEAATRLTSREMEVAVDRVYSKSSDITGDGIFAYIAGLSEVARQEIEASSLQSDQPRTYSLQKLVDVCYYNMGRIRVQWSGIWAVMNEVFQEFGCHRNTAISIFALDSLRQLAERFFEIEELAHFKFQKDFLQPFVYVIKNNPDVSVKDMVLECVHYMVMRKAASIRSGWSTLLAVLTEAAGSDNEQLVTKGYKYVDMVCTEHLEQVQAQEGFEALVECLTAFAKNDKYQKTSLRALHRMNSLLAQNEHLWHLLHGLHVATMDADDLEVRAQALNYMFDALVKYGSTFDSNYWSRVTEKLLFPIFAILSQGWQLASNQEDLWVWLSSTLIQALRRMIALFTTYYDTLNGQLDGYLQLLVSCICQENETISKVGISCLQDLILQNIDKFGQKQWKQIDTTFEKLFDLTRATELFEVGQQKEAENAAEENGDDSDASEVDEDDDLQQELQESADSASTVTPPVPSAVLSRKKAAIVIKCVLQLHMIQTVSELFDNALFYKHAPVEDLLKLADLLYKSYKFARDFNEDYELRKWLWNSGVMDKLPNLLMQETSAVGVYLSVMFRLYTDAEKSAERAIKDQIADTLIPLSAALLKRYNALDEAEQARNIESWLPVVIETVQACTEMDQSDFAKVCPQTYDLVLALFDKTMPPDLRAAAKDFFAKSKSMWH